MRTSKNSKQKRECFDKKACQAEASLDSCPQGLGYIRLGGGVIFSDKCMVEKSRNSRVDWVFRTQAEKWGKNCIQGVTKGPGVKAMVWGCL